MPEYFEHSIDLYYLWASTGHYHWLERGVFNGFALKRDGALLELCCGDGFYTKNFYNAISKKIIACDFDHIAIKRARITNKTNKIKFVVADIRKEIPDGIYDNIIMDQAIEHFTLSEIGVILKEIKARLDTNGIFSGSTIVERADGKKQLDYHEYEYKNKSDLMSVLKPFFKNVFIIQTDHPNCQYLYFFASDSCLPFSQNSTNIMISS